MAGPQNIIIGDDASYGLDIPETQQDDTAYRELQKAARFSRTAEFKALKQHLLDRIAFYQQYFPTGEQVVSKRQEECQNMWLPANVIVGEFNAVINAYEQAAKTVSEENARRKAASGRP